MPTLSYENLIPPDCTVYNYVECHMALWFWRIVPPVLLLFGTCGNILNITILSRHALRKYSTSMYLLFLAASDMTYLTLSLVTDAATALRLFSIYHLNDASCKLVEWLLYTSGLLSVWLLVMITLERLLAIKYPFTARHKMTPMFAFVTCITLLVALCLFTGHVLLQNQVVDVLTVTQNATHNWTMTERFCTQMPESHRVFYNGDWSLLLFIFGNVIPGTIIVIGNVVIAVTVINVRRSVRPIVQHRTVAQNVHKTPTKLLFALTVMFFCTTTPFAVYIVSMDHTRDVDGHTLARYQLFTVLTYCSLWFNNSFNFILYFMNGTLFKNEWKVIAQSITTSVRKAFNGPVTSTASNTTRSTVT